MIDIDSDKLYDNTNNAKICIIGVGGAGGNAVNNMVERGIEGVTFMVANTDKQALDRVKVADEYKILLGKTTTRGLGAGSKPEVGKKAAEENQEELRELLTGYDMIFVTCGMGGGTGTGAAPFIANIAKETDALVVGIVTKCFNREGPRKNDLALRGIEELKKNVDAYSIVPNQKILEVYGDLKTTEAYHKANDVLYNAVNGIVDIITDDSDLNVDFADIRTVLSDIGEVVISTGNGNGETAGKEAVIEALSSPFFEGLSVQDADFILLKIKYGSKYTMKHVNLAYDTLREMAGEPDIKGGEKELTDVEDEFVVTVLSPAKKTEKTINLNNDLDNNLKVQTDKIFNSNFSAFANNVSNNIYLTEENNNDLRSIEIIKNQGCGNRYGRPHGEEELKKYDVPTYLRVNKINVDVDNLNNTIPNDVAQAKVQRILNDSADFSSTKLFMNKLADTGLGK